MVRRKGRHPKVVPAKGGPQKVHRKWIRLWGWELGNVSWWTAQVHHNAWSPQYNVAFNPHAG